MRLKGRGQIPSEEQYVLESQLRASLVPLEAPPTFVESVRERLQQARPLYVPQAQTWPQAFVVFAGLGGVLFLLAGLTVFLFLRHGREEA